ncbi:MAG TPA: 50S ribosomal protein L7/L12 [Verrucomicrobiae bacterium]|nr:50S ribosomal protein L7/L12 [Verrucomicrobiae bacterium]
MADSKYAKLIEQIETLSVLELSELVKELEEKFGVSAAAPMMMGAMPAAGAADAEPVEEKTSFTVVLTDGGANKIGAIKAVREVRPDLGLKEAKDLVDGAPKNVLENVKKEEADAAVEKLKAGGATVEVK